MSDTKTRRAFAALGLAAKGGVAGAGLGMAAVGAWSLAAMAVALPLPDEAAMPAVTNAVSAVFTLLGVFAGFSSAFRNSLH